MSQGGNEYPTQSKTKEGSWIDHSLRRNCILTNVMKGRIEWTGRWDEDVSS
jgi:hypothetical protein